VIADAGTNTSPGAIFMTHRTSGTPVALFGTGLLGFAFLRRRNNGTSVFAAAA
jgi:hypothetical protein